MSVYQVRLVIIFCAFLCALASLREIQPFLCSEYPAKNGIHVAQVAAQVEDGRELRLGQVLGDVFILLHPLGKFAALLPDQHGRPLHQAVGRIPAQTLLDQGQQQALGEDQAVGRLRFLVMLSG